MPNTGEKKRGGGGNNDDESKYHRFIYIIIVGFGEGYRVVVRRDDRSIAARGVGGWVGGWVGGGGRGGAGRKNSPRDPSAWILRVSYANPRGVSRDIPNPGGDGWMG